MSDPQITALLDQLAENLQVVVLALEGAKAELDAAVVAEREACARIAEDYSAGISCPPIAAAIRARGVSVCPSVAATSITTP